MPDGIDFSAPAIVGLRRLSNQDILSDEVARARHTLAYLKLKIGNDAMRRLLDEDLQTIASQAQEWVADSKGAWQSDSTELTVPGPSAANLRSGTPMR